MAEITLINGLRPGSLVQAGGQGLGQLLGYDRASDKAEVVLLNGTLVTLELKDIKVPEDFRKPAEGGDSSSFDVLIGPKTQESYLAEEMAACIFEKGFCVLKTCRASEGAERSLQAIKDMADEGRLGRLPAEVEEGYLGADGKGKVIWLDPDDTENAVKDETLLANDRQLSSLASLLQPFSEDTVGKMIDERTPALLSLTLLADEEDDYPFPMADDKTLGDYLGTWQRGLLRAVHFMGPAEATVTLESKSGPEFAAIPNQVDKVEITATPNTIVLFRTQCFSYSCTSSEEVLTMMTSFLSAPLNFELFSWEGDPKILSLMKEGPPPPRGEGINIMTTNTRLGGNWNDPEDYRSGLMGGLDTVTEIPIIRFDYTFYFCENPDEITLGPPRTIQRHTSLVEGVEMFDNKYFEIMANEARAMGPLQRQVLEVGGTLLWNHGVSKKVANRTSHHAGCSVGLDKDDYTTLPDVDTGGTPNALAIIANRFSFVFNLKGPNYICDTACSASLTATHLAKPLLLDRVWDVLEFHVAVGTHLCLSVGPFIGTSMSRMVSPQGRCFSFDFSASGYLRGEGASGMLLKYGPITEKEKCCVYRASMVGQDGRSASLTAPNGPAQEMIITKALAEAGMSPIESTSWDCHGTGTSLGDPIEVNAVRKIMIKVERNEPLQISTCKTNIGHLEGGAAMATMCKCVQQAMMTACYQTCHFRQLNAHLENSAFDANFISEVNPFAYRQGNPHASSFGFGGTNGHVIFWGDNQIEPSVNKQLLKRLSRMAPPEVRPIGDDPGEWESDMPDPDAKPGDKFTITINRQDPLDAPIKYVKSESAEEEPADDEDTFFAITGNFNNWEEDRMAPGDASGQHTATVAVPEDGILEFRFLKEGSADKVICPKMPNCTRKSAPIVGPKPGLTNSWIVKATPDEEVQIELVALNGRYSVLWLMV
jgi:polyketide synthase-associated protein